MQCSAHARSGNQCRRHAIAGGIVCTMHGGAAPQVKRSAALRLAALVDPAIGVLTRALGQKKDVRVAVAVAQDILNRNGYKSAEEIKLLGSGPHGELEIAISPVEQLERGIARILERRRETGSSERADGAAAT